MVRTLAKAGKPISDLSVLAQFPLVLFHFPSMTPFAAEKLNADRPLLVLLEKSFDETGDLSPGMRPALAQKDLRVEKYSASAVDAAFYNLSGFSNDEINALRTQHLQGGRNKNIIEVQISFWIDYHCSVELATSMPLTEIEIRHLVGASNYVDTRPVLERIPRLVIVDALSSRMDVLEVVKDGETVVEVKMLRSLLSRPDQQIANEISYLARRVGIKRSW